MWPQEAKFKERRKGAVGGVVFFFLDQSHTSLASPPRVHLGCQVRAWFQAESCLMFTRAYSGPAAQSGPQATGWEVGVTVGALLCCTLAKCELLHCFVAGLLNNVGQSHPYRVKNGR